MTQFAFPVTGINSGYPEGSDGWAASFWANLALQQAFSRRYVINQTTNTPPGSPVAGDMYIIGASPTGAWASKAKQIAIYGESWYYIIPEAGFRDFYDAAKGAWFKHDGTNWVDQQDNETLITLRGMNVSTLPASGTVNLTRSETAAQVHIFVGTSTTADVTVQYDTENDDVVPATVYIINLFNPYDILVTSETVAETQRVLTNQTIELVTGLAASVWENYLPVFARETIRFGYQKQYEAAGPITASHDSFGKIVYTDDTALFEVTIPSNTTLPNQVSDGRIMLLGTSENGSKFVPDSGVTITGPVEASKDDLITAVKDGTTNTWTTIKQGRIDCEHGGISPESGTTYSLIRADRKKVKDMTNAAAVTVTVPKMATTDMGSDCIVYVRAGGAAGATLSPEDGTVTLVGVTALALNDVATLRKDGATNTWYINI